MIEITHTTHFDYDAEVVESAMEVRLEPRDDADQRRATFMLKLEPATRAFAYVDGFENTVHCFTIPRAHAQLEVIARSRVETRLTNPFATPRRPVGPAEPVDVWSYLQFGGPVTQLPEVTALADRFRPGSEEGVLDALRGLMAYIFASFEYQAEVTTVTSTVGDLLTVRKGVCQDFAHLMIAVCRAMAVPARYVSGYICGAPGQAARGDGASHAWCEAWVPGYGWRGFDPTNDLLAADMHVKVGVGRNYHDVPPTRGVYRGTAGQQVDVRVKAIVLDSDLI